MKIPIQNIYYLLCYAWDKLAERDVVSVEALDGTTLVDLFARVLINGTNHLVIRGFDRGYVPRREWTWRLRGRFCFSEAIRRSAGALGQLPCDFDEHGYNVLHNQILKGTIRRLLRVQGLAPESAESLARIWRLFAEIDDIDVTSRMFGQVQLHRNNQFYDFLLRVCELIHHNLLVSEKSGASKFADFIRDEQQMAALFEAFVRSFYRVNTKFEVGRENLMWRWKPENDFSKSFLPMMRTDISLVSQDRKIIIECKFTPDATQSHYEAEKLRSAHLYQLNAYMDNLEGSLADTCEMMLLYPATDKLFHPVSFIHKRHRISVHTINLNQPWQAIHHDLLALVQ